MRIPSGLEPLDFARSLLLIFFCSCFLCPSPFRSIWEFPFFRFLSLHLLFLFSVLLTFSLFIFDYLWEIFRSGSWRGLQNLLPKGSILWLTDSLQSTVLSSKAISATVVYHRAWFCYQLVSFLRLSRHSPPCCLCNTSLTSGRLCFLRY